MRLTYLGASYVPSTQTIETETELLFMGQPFKMRVPKRVPVQSAARNLTYRGARYSA